MEPTRSTARQRQEASQAASLRRRKLSVSFGVIGLGALFGGAIATMRYPGAIVPLALVMVAGVVFLIIAFALIRAPKSSVLLPSEK